MTNLLTPNFSLGEWSPAVLCTKANLLMLNSYPGEWSLAALHQKDYHRS